MNRELPDVQAGFRKGRGTRDQIANICWIMEKAREFQKNIYFCFIDYAKAFDFVDHDKLENSAERVVKELQLCCLDHWFSTWDDFAPFPMGTLAMSGDNFGCHS